MNGFEAAWAKEGVRKSKRLAEKKLGKTTQEKEYKHSRLCKCCTSETKNAIQHRSRNFEGPTDNLAKGTKDSKLQKTTISSGKVKIKNSVSSNDQNCQRTKLNGNVLNQTNVISPRRSLRVAGKFQETGIDKSPRRNEIKPKVPTIKKKVKAVQNQSKLGKVQTKPNVALKQYSSRSHKIQPEPEVVRKQFKSEASKKRKQHKVATNRKELNAVETKPKPYPKKRPALRDTENFPPEVISISQAEINSKQSMPPKKKRISSKTTTKITDVKVHGTSKISEESMSFIKYGISVPTDDEIRRGVQKKKAEIERMKKLFDDMEERHTDSTNQLIHDPVKVTPDIIEENPIELWDCKHLNPEELNNHFKNNIQYLTNISLGIEFSKRHEKFLKCLDVRFFSYSPEICMYTHDQIQQLAQVLEEDIPLGNKDFSYYFKVLIPEICLKIFMDVYNMNVEEAKAYIEKTI